MNCRRFRKQLHEYLDGALAPDSQADAKRHLDHCDACRRAMQEEQEIAQFLSARLHERADAIALSSEAQSRIAAAARRECSEAADNRPPIRLWIRFALPLAAAAALAILAVSSGFFGGKRSAQTKAAPSANVARESAIIINMSYRTPTYTFRREGNFVIDALTSDNLVVNESMSEVAQH